MTFRYNTQPMRHGYVAYSNGCRCITCTAAKREYIAAQRAQRRDARKQAQASGRPHIVDGIFHGVSGYDNFMCRCEVCVAAKKKPYQKKDRRTPVRSTPEGSAGR